MRSLIQPRLVTLLGAWPLKHPWVVSCMNSWERIEGLQKNITVLSDGTITRELCEQIGLPILCEPEAQETAVYELIQKYPALKTIRASDITWRKILDTLAMANREDSPLLLIDTDVYIRAPVILPISEKRNFIMYLREDIPAYRANWLAPLCEPMVKSFNAGMVLFDKSVIDLDFLEFAVARYVLHCRNFWWSEQFAWSLLAARAEHRFFWDGNSARVVSGFGTRTPGEISSNVVKYISKRDSIESLKEMLSYCGSAPIVHMAGGGKKWFEALLPGKNDGEPILVEIRRDTLLTVSERLKISARLWAKEKIR
jgi:hypothetical protein